MDDSNLSEEQIKDLVENLDFFMSYDESEAEKDWETIEDIPELEKEEPASE